MQRIIKILVKEHLDESWIESFEGFDIIYDKENTFLSGEIKDEAMLYRILNRIRDLNLKLISLDSIEKQNI